MTMHDEEFRANFERKRRARMDAIDAMPVELRSLVNEYGYKVVRTLMDVGVEKPKHIRHVVETVLNEFSPTRGSFSAQGIRTLHDLPQPPTTP